MNTTANNEAHIAAPVRIEVCGTGQESLLIGNDCELILSTYDATAAELARIAACLNVCDGIDTAALETVGVGAMLKLRDKSHDERAAAQSLIIAARRLLDAFGGDVPKWLREEASALAEAIAAATTPPSAAETTHAVERAEQFIAGFEDDDTQEGVPELLADLRRILGR